jgi:predicted nucleic acid-binding protein
MSAVVEPPTVIADANVLHGSAPRDILIELALIGIIRLCWSPRILDELVHSLVRARSDYSTAKGQRLVLAMNTALPDALVTPTSVSLPVDALPDPRDVHVLEAARDGECAAILTFNIKDFPDDRVALHVPGMTVTHPDAFFVKLLTTRATMTLSVIETVRQNLTAPPMSVAEYSDSLARSNLVQTAELFRLLAAH